jgi:hypothetical protein
MVRRAAPVEGEDGDEGPAARGESDDAITAAAAAAAAAAAVGDASPGPGTCPDARAAALRMYAAASAGVTIKVSSGTVLRTAALLLPLLRSMRACAPTSAALPAAAAAAPEAAPPAALPVASSSSFQYGSAVNAPPPAAA